jgi:hypothetical protein
MPTDILVDAKQRGDGGTTESDKRIQRTGLIHEFWYKPLA